MTLEQPRQSDGPREASHSFRENTASATIAREQNTPGRSGNESYLAARNSWTETAKPPSAHFDGQSINFGTAYGDNSSGRDNAKTRGEQYASLSLSPELRSDASEGRKNSISGDKQVADSREKLLQNFDKNQPDERLRENFRASVDTFENRASRDQLKPEEVAKTYQSVNDMVSSDKGEVPQEGRVKLAAQVLDQAARPDSIQQGQYGTCVPSAMEHALYQNKPSVAADMVKQASLTGHWTAPDGKDIDVTQTGALTPRPDSTGTYPANGDRSFATQITNNVLMNDMKGRFRESYVQLGKTESDGKTPLAEGDSGERVVYAGEPIKQMDGKPVSMPGSGDYDTDQELQRLGIASMMKDGPGTNPNVKAPRFGSPEELHNLLKDMSNKKQFPALDSVDGGDPRLTGRADSQPGAHEIAIDKYDPETRQATVFTWGQQKQMSVKDLYEISR